MKKSDASKDNEIDALPFSKAFWIDDELMDVIGLGSMGLIRDLQKRRLIAPGRYKTAAGKWARAWSSLDVLRVALVSEVAQQTGFSMAAAAVICSMLGATPIDLALSTDEMFSRLKSGSKQILEDHAGRTKSATRAWGNATIVVPRRHAIQLVVIDRRWIRTDAELQHAGEKSSLRHQQHIGELMDSKTGSPSIVFRHSDEDLKISPKSELRVNLHALVEDLPSVVFGTNIRIARRSTH